MELDFFRGQGLQRFSVVYGRQLRGRVVPR